MKFSQEETSIDNLRALCLRWNRAAAKYAAGSEYVDDPERVFAAIKRRMEFQEKVAHRKVGQIIALLEQETSASLKLLEGSGAKPVGVLGELRSNDLDNYVTPLAVQP
jgi:hypothetical protein